MAHRRSAAGARVTLAFLVLVGLSLPRTASAQSARQRLAALEQRARADSNDPVVHHQLAFEYYQQKKWDQAEASWREALALSPHYAEPMLGLALVPFRRHDNHWRDVIRQRGEGYVDSLEAASLRWVRRAFLSDPLLDLSLLGEYKPRMGFAFGGGQFFEMQPPWWFSDYVRGVNRLREGRTQEAWDRFERILEDPRARDQRENAPDPLVWHHGLAAARLGKFEVAAYDFAVLTGRAVADEKESDGDWLPNDTNVYRFLMSLMNFMAGKLPESAAGFRRVLEFDVGLFQANVQLARIYETAGQWDEAVRQREQAVLVNPDDPALLIDLGGALLKAGQLERAREVLADAMERAPRNPRAPLTLGLVSLQLGDSVAAGQALRHFLAIAPSSFSQQIQDARARLAVLPPTP